MRHLKNWMEVVNSNVVSSNSSKPSGPKSNGQSKLGIFVQGLGVNLSRDCQHWLGYDLMLQESP